MRRSWALLIGMCVPKWTGVNLKNSKYWGPMNFLKKVHWDFVTIISVHLRNGKNRVLGVLEDRKKEKCENFLRAYPRIT